MNEQTDFRVGGFHDFMQFSVVVSSGSGHFSFPVPISGELFFRSILAPAGAGQFAFYFQNTPPTGGTAVISDVHTATPPSSLVPVDIDDVTLLVLETQFYIVNANGDGAYLVSLKKRA